MALHGGNYLCMEELSFKRPLKQGNSDDIDRREGDEECDKSRDNDARDRQGVIDRRSVNKEVDNRSALIVQ